LRRSAPVIFFESRRFQQVFSENFGSRVISVPRGVSPPPRICQLAALRTDVWQVFAEFLRMAREGRKPSRIVQRAVPQERTGP
jgi:hypothetical protein